MADNMIIDRPVYLNQLIESRGNGMIKIVTGIRRCGKSFLLGKLFVDWLHANVVSVPNIIHVALDDLRNKELRNPLNLLNYIEVKQSPKNNLVEFGIGIIGQNISYMCSYFWLLCRSSSLVLSPSIGCASA